VARRHVEKAPSAWSRRLPFKRLDSEIQSLAEIRIKIWSSVRQSHTLERARRETGRWVPNGTAGCPSGNHCALGVFTIAHPGN
jgi:hypothetical protein